MPQYYNPYEGVGNALINIGQNMDADRRRKKEAEEDQKRRRADYKWQSQQEEERAAREYARAAPEREMAMRLKTLQLAKAQADAVSARLPKITNLPGAGGSFVDELVTDESGNVTGATRKLLPYVALPQRELRPQWETGYDKDGNMVMFDPNDPAKRVVTDLRGTAPPRTELTPDKLASLKNDRFKALQDARKLTDEQIAGMYGIDTSSRTGSSAAIKAAREQEEARINAHYDSLLRPAVTGTPFSDGLARMGRGLMDRFTPRTETDVMADLEAGNISADEAAAQLAVMTNGPTSINLSGAKAKAEAPAKNKEKDVRDTAEFKAALAAEKKKWPDASEAELTEFLLDTTFRARSGSK